MAQCLARFFSRRQSLGRTFVAGDSLRLPRAPFVARARAAGHNATVTSAAELIGLETAMRDLARLYESALVFAPLRSRADGELLPQMSELGLWLRRQLRLATLGPREIEDAASRIHALMQQWEETLASVRASETVRAATAAYERNDQDSLRELVPRLFAGHRSLRQVPEKLYHAVSVTAPRIKAPRTQPFLTAREAAERIVARQDGIQPDPSGPEWWERAFPYVAMVEEWEALDAPVAIALDLRRKGWALFRVEGQTALRVYTRLVRQPFAVVLASDASDERWQSAEAPYLSFRDELRKRLEAAGLEVRLL
jgi:hypothetical protein